MFIQSYKERKLKKFTCHNCHVANSECGKENSTMGRPSFTRNQITLDFGFPICFITISINGPYK